MGEREKERKKDRERGRHGERQRQKGREIKREERPWKQEGIEKIVFGLFISSTVFGCTLPLVFF